MSGHVLGTRYKVHSLWKYSYQRVACRQCCRRLQNVQIPNRNQLSRTRVNSLGGMAVEVYMFEGPTCCYTSCFVFAWALSVYSTSPPWTWPGVWPEDLGRRPGWVPRAEKSVHEKIGWGYLSTFKDMKLLV
jgi:hypothetical protein